MIEHIPLVVEPEDYQVVVNEVQQTLETTGWKTRREPAPWMLTVPTKVLTTRAGSTASKLIGEQLVTLVSSDLEVILHPSDMAISGKKTEVGRVRAALAHQLAFSTAYLTWNKDANMLEDRIRGVWNELRSSHDGEIPPQSIRELAEIEEAMRKAELPYEEWQTLDRAKLLVERGMLQMLAGVVSVRPEPQGMSPERMGARQIERANSESGRWVTDAASIAFFAVLAWLGFTLPKDSHVSR